MKKLIETLERRAKKRRAERDFGRRLRGLSTNDINIIYFEKLRIFSDLKAKTEDPECSVRDRREFVRARPELYSILNSLRWGFCDRLEFRLEGRDPSLLTPGRDTELIRKWSQYAASIRDRRIDELGYSQYKLAKEREKISFAPTSTSSEEYKREGAEGCAWVRLRLKGMLAGLPRSTAKSRKEYERARREFELLQNSSAEMSGSAFLAKVESVLPWSPEEQALLDRALNRAIARQRSPHSRTPEEVMVLFRQAGLVSESEAERYLERHSSGVPWPADDAPTMGADESRGSA
jgi:hypothetical protein